MRAVNLLPKEQVQKRVPNKLVLAGASSSSAVLMLLGAAYLSAQGTVKNREGTLADAKAELAALPKPKTSRVASAYEQQLVQDRIGRLGALSSVLSQRVRWDRLLRELALVLPGDVWLQQLTASAPTVAQAATAPVAPAPPTSSGTTFSIGARTYTQEGVARLLIRLQLVPDLQNITLVSSTLRGDGSYDVSVSADVKPPEVTS